MRSLKDAELIRFVALPAAGHDASTTPLDLTQGPPQEDCYELEVHVPALPSLADGKSATVTLEDSVDGITFAAIAALAPIKLTGAGGAGSTEVTRRVCLPSTTRQHVRATVAVDAAGGDNTAKQVTMAMLF
jgi:hypothetical protein